MNFDLILGIVFLLLVGFMLALRTRGGFVILGLCGGFVLATTLNENIFNLTKNANVTLPGITLAQILQLVVTLIPAAIVAAHFYKSQRGLNLLQQLAPSLGVVGLLVVFAQPILEQSSIKSTLENSQLWGLFTDYRTYIIFYAMSVSLMGILLDGHSKKPKRGRPRKLG